VACIHIINNNHNIIKRSIKSTIFCEYILLTENNLQFSIFIFYVFIQLYLTYVLGIYYLQNTDITTIIIVPIGTLAYSIL